MDIGQYKIHCNSMQSKQNIKQPALLASQYCKHEKIQEFKKLENVFHIFPDGLFHSLKHTLRTKGRVQKKKSIEISILSLPPPP